MNIIEATKKALEESRYIYNKKSPIVKLIPWNSLPFDICGMDGSNTRHNWNPTGEDILSDDWDVCN